MNKRIIALIIASITTFSVGCSTKNNTNIKDKSNEDAQIGISTSSNANIKNESNKDTQIQKEVSNNLNLEKDEMYNLHKELLPQVESLFTELKIDYNPKSINNNIENYKILYKNNKESIPGKIKTAGYEAIIKENSKIEEINANIFQALDSKDIMKSGFKFTDTSFYKLSKIFIKQDVDYSEIDKKINETFKDNRESIIENDYENVHERIIVNGKQIAYELSIKVK